RQLIGSAGQPVTEPSEQPSSEHFDQPMRPRSRAVTVAALAGFLVGGLHLCYCLPFLLKSTAMVARAARLPLAAEMNNGLKFLGNDEEALILTFLGAIPALFGVLLVLAGIGLLRRRRWGRTLALGVGGFMGVMALFVGSAVTLEYLSGKHA